MLAFCRCFSVFFSPTSFSCLETSLKNEVNLFLVPNRETRRPQNFPEALQNPENLRGKGSNTLSELPDAIDSFAYANIYA